MNPPGKLARCAIYTRKSTDHNLDMELNRDRDMVDADTLFERINQVWDGSEITDRQMQAYWQNVDRASKLEYRNVMRLTGDNLARMLSAFKKVFGKLRGKGSLRNGAGGHARNIWARWFRWMVVITIGWKVAARGWC